MPKTKLQSVIFTAIMVFFMVFCMTVCLMVPTITLIVTFIHNGFNANWFTSWITTAVKCFPMALCLQLFFVGPLVRHIFALLMKLTQKKDAVPAENA